MEIVITVVLCMVGILLILAEIFLIPGITVAGVGGILFSVAGVYFAFHSLGATAGIITLIMMLLVVGISFIVLVKSKALDAISLKTDINSTVADDLPAIAVGDTGISISRLNPIGKVRVNNITVEAKTPGYFIDENCEIEVVKVFKNQIIVKMR
ncbi:MAG: hypothetical protein LBJ17_02890 [Dysgonamonadaceae bacterium]|jgi:membrane-bound ClpP family serine protease|nr:hypothetical protein [Dysgonamonadaceae bacterium]